MNARAHRFLYSSAVEVEYNGVGLLGHDSCMYPRIMIIAANTNNTSIKIITSQYSLLWHYLTTAFVDAENNFIVVKKTMFLLSSSSSQLSLSPAATRGAGRPPTYPWQVSGLSVFHSFRLQGDIPSRGSCLPSTSLPHPTNAFAPVREVAIVSSSSPCPSLHDPPFPSPA